MSAVNHSFMIDTNLLIYIIDNRGIKLTFESKRCELEILMNALFLTGNGGLLTRPEFLDKMQPSISIYTYYEAIKGSAEKFEMISSILTEYDIDLISDSDIGLNGSSKLMTYKELEDLILHKIKNLEDKMLKFFNSIEVEISRLLKEKITQPILYQNLSQLKALKNKFGYEVVNTVISNLIEECSDSKEDVYFYYYLSQVAFGQKLLMERYESRSKYPVQRDIKNIENIIIDSSFSCFMDKTKIIFTNDKMLKLSLSNLKEKYGLETEAIYLSSLYKDIDEYKKIMKQLSS